MSEDLRLAFLREAGDPSRLRILRALSCGPKTVSEIVDETSLKQPNASNHLARMKRSGLVRAMRAGKNVIYSIASPQVSEEVRAYAQGAEPGCPEMCREVTNSFARTALSGDEAACTQIVDSLIEGGESVLKIYQHLFTPSLHTIGEWWQQGEITEAQEHLASGIIERLIFRTMHVCPKPPVTRGTAMLGCCEGSWHSIGLRMIGDAMRLSGWRVLYLGASVPTESFAASAEEHQPNVVLVSCSIEDALPECLALIRRLRSDSWTLGAGGRPFLQQPEAALQAGADFVCTSLEQFVEEVLPDLPAKEKGLSG